MTGKTLIKWIVGCVFLFGGVSGALQKEYGMLLLIPIGLFIIPPTYQILIEEKANLKLTSKTKWIVVIVGILIGSSANTIIKHSKKNENLTENGSIKNDDRNTKIELTKYYLENHYRTVTDKDGISYEVKVEKNEVSRTKIYESEEIKYTRDGRSIFIIVSSFKVIYDFKLLSNGEVIDVIKYEGYLMDSKSSEGTSAQIWCNDNYTYFPELDSENKKEIISNFTGGNCGMGDEVNNKVKRERIAAVKASGIIDAE
jgi:hypothetical protein